jgi:hypothetical protein
VVTHRHKWQQGLAIRLRLSSDWPNNSRNFMRGN